MGTFVAGPYLGYGFFKNSFSSPLNLRGNMWASISCGNTLEEHSVLLPLYFIPKFPLMVIYRSHLLASSQEVFHTVSATNTLFTLHLQEVEWCWMVEVGVFKNMRRHKMEGVGKKNQEKNHHLKNGNLRLWFFWSKMIKPVFLETWLILTSTLSASKRLWKTHTWKILIKLWVILDHFNSCLWGTAVQYLIARGKWIHAPKRHCHLQKPRKKHWLF